MKGIFISEKDELQVDVRLYYTSKNEIFASHDLDDLMETVVEDGGKIEDAETISVTFRRPSYKDSVDSTSNSVKATPDGDIILDPNEARMSLMKAIIKSWTLTDDNGEAVPATIENINKLHPVVAGAIGFALEDKLNKIS